MALSAYIAFALEAALSRHGLSTLCRDCLRAVASGQVILPQNVVKSILRATQEVTNGTTVTLLCLFVRKLGSGEFIGLAKVCVGLEVEGLQTCAFCSNTVEVAAAQASKQAKGLCDCQRLHQEVVSARPGSTLERQRKNEFQASLGYMRSS